MPHSPLGKILFVGLLLLPSLALADSLKSAASSGRKLYENYCARCHGLNAKGLPDRAKELKTDWVHLDLTREEVVKKSVRSLEALIVGGHGKMPKQASLTRKEVRAVLKYLQSLQRAYAEVKAEGKGK